MPDTFRGKMSECIIALEMAHRNEFSDKRWVYRFKISKAKENLAKIKKYRDSIRKEVAE